MRVTVRPYGDLRRQLAKGQETLNLELPENATVLQMLEKAGVDPGEVWVVRANKQIVAENQTLHDGDDVEIFEPVGGGECTGVRGVLPHN